MSIITAATIHRYEHEGRASVTVDYADGTTGKLFDYYLDELSFTAREFIGLTASQAKAMRHARDVEYLQS